MKTNASPSSCPSSCPPGRMRVGRRLTSIVSLSVAASLAACVSTGGTNKAADGTGTGAAAPTKPGCKTLPMSDTKRTALSAAAGAVAGGLIGATTSNRHKGRNAAGGALAGALVGALASSAFKNEIDVEEQDDGSVRLKIPGSVMFASGRSDLSPGFQSTLVSVAGTVRQYCDLSVLVVGHTDSVGSAAANQKLSLDRAHAVVTLFRAQGLERLNADGRGANQPVASNADEAGRQANRRVEVFVRPPAP